MRHIVLKAECTYSESQKKDSTWEQICLEGKGGIGEVGKKCLCIPENKDTYCPYVKIEAARSTMVLEDYRGIVIDSVVCNNDKVNETQWILEQAEYIETESENIDKIQCEGII